MFSAGETAPACHAESWWAGEDRSAAECCMCDHRLSVPEREEFYGKVDEALRGEMLCRSCVSQYLQLCRECSGRYTADEVCSECSTGVYGRVG